MSAALPSVSIGQFAIHGIELTLTRDIGWMCGEDIVELRLRLRVNDVENPHRETETGNVLRLPLYQLERYRDTNFVKRWIQDAVYKGVMHEVDEWLRIDGELVTDPHPKAVSR